MNRDQILSAKCLPILVPTLALLSGAWGCSSSPALPKCTSGQVLVASGSGWQCGTEPTGAPGTNGTDGTNGMNGVNGATGTMGANGMNGTNGATGAMGATGMNGMNGATGAMGATGMNGTNGATGAMGTTGSAGATGPTGGVLNPPPPALFPNEIDRMGRAGVNTALTAPFATATANGTAKDAYNAVYDPTQWQADFMPEIAANIAIYDGLDGVCGNQLLAGQTATPGRYNTFAGILTNDLLWVNSASGACTQYLAVEANAVGITNSDCGGRTPLYNTIDTTYSVLAIGALSGVSNGITSKADGTPSNNAFPFLVAPQP